MARLVRNVHLRRLGLAEDAPVGEALENLANVPRHAECDRATNAIKINRETKILLTSPINLDLVESLKTNEEVLGTRSAVKLDAEVVNN